MTITLPMGVHTHTRAHTHTHLGSHPRSYNLQPLQESFRWRQTTQNSFFTPILYLDISGSWMQLAHCLVQATICLFRSVSLRVRSLRSVWDSLRFRTVLHQFNKASISSSADAQRKDFVPWNTDTQCGAHGISWNTTGKYAEMKTGLLCPLFGCWPNPQGVSHSSYSCVLHRTPKFPKLPKLIISTAVGGQVPGCSIASQRPRKGELFMKQLGTTNWN